MAYVDTFRAMDEQEQEARLHDAKRIAWACAEANAAEVTLGYTWQTLIRALAVLGAEDIRVTELEADV